MRCQRGRGADFAGAVGLLRLKRSVKLQWSCVSRQMSLDKQGSSGVVHDAMTVIALGQLAGYLPSLANREVPATAFPILCLPCRSDPALSHAKLDIVVPVTGSFLGPHLLLILLQGWLVILVGDLVLTSPTDLPARWNDAEEMHEILTLQLGNLSNYTGTHFWNTQESYFTYDGQEKSSVDHNVLWRPGVGQDGSDTFLPRTVIYDLKGGFGSMRKINALYDATSDVNAAADSLWLVKPCDKMLIACLCLCRLITNDMVTGPGDPRCTGNSLCTPAPTKRASTLALSPKS